VSIGQVSGIIDGAIRGAKIVSDSTISSAVRSIATAAGITTARDTDAVVIFTGTTTQTYAMPACATGRIVTIKNRSTGNVTLDLAGADTFDGSTDNIVVTQNESYTFVGSGTDWSIK
jgi:hypothetical protein